MVRLIVLFVENDRGLLLILGYKQPLYSEFGVVLLLGIRVAPFGVSRDLFAQIY